MTNESQSQLIQRLSKPKYTLGQAEDFSNFVKKFIMDNDIDPLIVFDTTPLIHIWKKERGIK